MTALMLACLILGDPAWVVFGVLALAQAAADRVVRR